MTLWWEGFRRGAEGRWKLVCKGKASCLNDLLHWNVWNFLLQRTTKWTLAFRYSENFCRLPATFLAYAETTHVLIKIIIYKIYHILCLFWVNSQPWKTWVMLCGKGSWLYFSLVGQRWEIKVEGIIIKVRMDRKWTHVYVASQDQEISWCSLVWPVKNTCDKKKRERERERPGKNISSSGVDGRWSEEKGQMMWEFVFVLMTGILMEKWIVQSQNSLQSYTFS